MVLLRLRSLDQSESVFRRETLYEVQERLGSCIDPSLIITAQKALLARTCSKKRGRRGKNRKWPTRHRTVQEAKETDQSHAPRGAPLLL